eukprot:5668281-Prymnesium_polylepis.1
MPCFALPSACPLAQPIFSSILLPKPFPTFSNDAKSLSTFSAGCDDDESTSAPSPRPARAPAKSCCCGGGGGGARLLPPPPPPSPPPSIGRSPSPSSLRAQSGFLLSLAGLATDVTNDTGRFESGAWPCRLLPPRSSSSDSPSEPKTP